MPPVYFLKIDGIQGGSHDPNQVDELELESVIWHESGTAPHEPATITFTARSSIASAPLFLACAEGRMLAAAVLTIRDPEDRREPIRKWRFSDVAISDYATAAGATGPIDQVTLSAEFVEALASPPLPALRLEVLRPDDLLNLEIATVNLRLEGEAGDQALVVDDPALPARLSILFPPQTIAETAYFRSSDVPEVEPAPGERPFDPPGSTGPPPRDGTARIANPSRLVFNVPAETRLPFTIEGLLDWSVLEPQVSPIAAIPPDPTDEQIAAASAIRPPEADETALELPYRLLISPNRTAEWQHRSRPFARRGRTELWHTQLATRAGQDPVQPSFASPVPLRAIWSPDYSPFDPPAPEALDPNLGLTAMAPNDRHQLVILTSAFHGYENEVELAPASSPFGDARFRLGRNIPFRLTLPFVPEPFEAELLMLSALGGWLRSRGHWTPPRQIVRDLPFRPDLRDIFRLALPARTERRGAEVPADRRVAAPLGRFVHAGEQLNLSEWVHIAAQGRDHYVRIVYEGALKPFGNRAALVKVTERKFIENGGMVAAYLVQQMFVVVREPERQFSPSDRGMPFKKVRLTTIVTPPIASPNYVVQGSRSFWVEVNTEPGNRDRFTFHGVGTDVTGQEVDFTVPMMFVSIAATGSTLSQALGKYNETKSAADLANRDLRVPGQQLAFAEPDSDPSKRNSQLVTESLNFIVDPASGGPRLLKGDVRIPQVQEILGTAAATTVRLYADFVAVGLDSASGVFAEIAKPDFTKFTEADPLGGMVASTVGVDFSADKAGGFATPNLGVSTLSRDLGPLAGDAADAVTDSFNPTSFFGTGLAMLFGSFDLAKLLPASTLGENAPKLRTNTNSIPDGKLIATELEWAPRVEDLSAGVVNFEKDHGGLTQLEVHGVIKRTVKLGGPPAPPEFSFTGTLNDFQVGVLGSIYVNFVEFSFAARSEQKPDVKVDARL